MDDFKLEGEAIIEPQKAVPKWGTKAWVDHYKRHISSAYWKNLKRIVVKTRGRACEVCGTNVGVLELHHLTYERFGSERLEDVKLVCHEHHRNEDRKRELRVAAKSESRRQSAAFNTWFTKKYGENCPYYPTEADYQDFLQWLSEKEGDYY